MQKEEMAELQKVGKHTEKKKDNAADEAIIDLKHLEKKESNKKSGSKVKEDHEEGSTNPVSEKGADAADKNEDSAIFESRKNEKKDNKRKKKKEKIEKHDMSSSLSIPFRTSVLEEASGIRKKRARDGELDAEMDMKHRDSKEMLDSVKKGSKKHKCKDNDKSNIVVEKIESSGNEKKKKKRRKEDNSIRIENDESNSKEKMEQPSGTKEIEEDDEREISDKKRKKENDKIVKETFVRKEGQPHSKKKSNKSRSVSFSGEVEVFPFSSDASDEELVEKDLVQGKRFSQEEDSLLKQAVLKYIEGLHCLGGLIRLCMFVLMFYLKEVKSINGILKITKF